MNSPPSPTELISLVMDSENLSDFRATDTHLENLLSVISRSPETWQTQREILISSAPALPASHYESIYSRRLRLAPIRPDTEQVRTAMAQLVKYCSLYPDALIQLVAINGPQHS